MGVSCMRFDDLMWTTCFWNNRHGVRSKTKYWPFQNRKNKKSSVYSMLYTSHEIIIYNVKLSLNLSLWKVNPVMNTIMIPFVAITTLHNIPAISWLSVLFLEKTRGTGENHKPVADKLYHIMSCISLWSKFELTYR